MVAWSWVSLSRTSSRRVLFLIHDTEQESNTLYNPWDPTSAQIPSAGAWVWRAHSFIDVASEIRNRNCALGVRRFICRYIIGILHKWFSEYSSSDQISSEASEASEGAYYSRRRGTVCMPIAIASFFWPRKGQERKSKVSPWGPDRTGSPMYIQKDAVAAVYKWKWQAGVTHTARL